MYVFSTHTDSTHVLQAELTLSTDAWARGLVPWRAQLWGQGMQAQLLGSSVTQDLLLQTSFPSSLKWGWQWLPHRVVGRTGWDHRACKAAGLAWELGLFINSHHTNNEVCLGAKQTPQSTFLEQECAHTPAHPLSCRGAWEKGWPMASVWAGYCSGNPWVSDRHKTVNGCATTASVMMER